MKRKPIKTSKKQILEYHYEHTDESGMGADASEWHSHCWRCGHERDTERCHIIPHSLGGEDVPSNYVLLCPDCHAEAPNVNDSEEMMKWIKRTSISSYNTYWKLRGILDKRIRDVSKHFGATRERQLTPSTANWLHTKIIEDLKDMYGENYIYTFNWMDTILKER